VLKRTKKLLKKIAEMLYKNCDKFGLTKQDEEVKELKELIDKIGERVDVYTTILPWFVSRNIWNCCSRNCNCAD